MLSLPIATGDCAMRSVMVPCCRAATSVGIASKPTSVIFPALRAALIAAAAPWASGPSAAMMSFRSG